MNRRNFLKSVVMGVATSAVILKLQGEAEAKLGWECSCDQINDDFNSGRIPFPDEVGWIRGDNMLKHYHWSKCLKGHGQYEIVQDDF